MVLNFKESLTGIDVVVVVVVDVVVNVFVVMDVDVVVVIYVVVDVVVVMAITFSHI